MWTVFIDWYRRIRQENLSFDMSEIRSITVFDSCAMMNRDIIWKHSVKKWNLNEITFRNIAFNSLTKSREISIAMLWDIKKSYTVVKTIVVVLTTLDAT